MTPIIFGLIQAPTGIGIHDIWIPITAAVSVVLAVVGGTWAVGRVLNAQKDKMVALSKEIADLRTDMVHRFERLEDRHATTVSHKEWYRWCDRLRRENENKIVVPPPFLED